jgi:hypothetical protein
MSLLDEMNSAVRRKEEELGRKLTPDEEYQLCLDIELDRELTVYGTPDRLSAEYALTNRNHPYFKEYAECPTCGDYFLKRFLDLHRKSAHTKHEA